MLKRPQYLLRRAGGNIYFRLAVPIEPRSALKNREIKRIIISEDIRRYGGKANWLVAKWKNVFWQMRQFAAGNDSNRVWKLTRGDISSDARSGETKIGKAVFDPDNLEAESAALSNHMP
jgi:hypothetical protein